MCIHDDGDDEGSVSFRLFNIKTYVKNTIGKTVQSISSLC
jgi:hypothetical protein